MATTYWFDASATKLGLEAAKDVARRMGGKVMGIGVLALVVGIAALANTFVSTRVTVYVLGAFLVAGGIISAVNAFASRQWNVALLEVLAAVVYFAAGAACFRYPDAAATTLTFLVAGFFMVSGFFRSIGAIAMRPTHWGWEMLHGIATSLLGLALFAGFPVTGLTGLGLLVGVDLLLGGIATTAFGMEARRVGGGGRSVGAASRGLAATPS